MSEYLLTKGELYHHGILGQKWGKRNGPPYPLDEEDHSKREIKEDYKKSLGGGRNEELYDRNDKSYIKKEKEHDKNINKKYKAKKSDLNYIINKKKIETGIKYAKLRAREIINSDEFKIAVGLGITLAALYAYKRITTKEVYDLSLGDMVADRDEIQTFEHYQDLYYDSIDDIPKSGINYAEEYFKTGDASELLHNNNYYKDGELISLVKNPFKLIAYSIKDPEGYSMINNRSNNCMLCTTNMIMRLKGYDTMAQPTNTGNGWSPGMIKEWFKDAEVVAPGKYTRSGLLKELSSQGEGAYGNFICYWKAGGGHSILYTVRNDGVHFIDGQIGKEYTYHELFSKMNPENCRYARLDKCEITELALRAIMPSDPNKW